MTESKICTCPSGDGSLRWPCPKHPAVEQAGGDERAAFNRWIAEQQLCQGSDISLFKLERNGALVSLHELLRDAYQAGQDRAALAQPSPVRSSLLINGYQLRAALDFIAPDGTAEQLKSEACIEWRQQDADFLEAGLYAFCAEYPEEGGVLLDEEPTNSQPSPAQAEAERPEVVARVVHSNPVVLGQCGPLNANDELMTVAQHAASVARWAEMFNRVEQQRDAALARVADLEKQVAVAWGAFHFGGERDGKLYTHSETEAQIEAYILDMHRSSDSLTLRKGPLYAGPVAQAQQLNDLDKQCRDDVARALGLRPNQERGFAWSYLLASIKSCVKASGDSAQAQHSVPVPVVTPEMVMAAMAVFRLDVSPFKSMEAALIAARRKAAAPGKEVGHE
ncbi:hypothetical protein [Pseudomonas aeruginosa]|uniref:hypothetical protein n=1 Tax=Pseudomonas aeruginosa TaxID=287 RepID=UPI0018E01562|nr:hypothetical protein [Pseudomonas aeruginosa]